MTGLMGVTVAAALTLAALALLLIFAPLVIALVAKVYIRYINWVADLEIP